MKTENNNVKRRNNVKRSNTVKCSTKNIIQEFFIGTLVLGMISGIIPILAVALIGNLLGIY